MKFIWAEGKGNQKNVTLAFCYKQAKKGDILRLAAGDFYRVFLNGQFLSFGPSRTAAGYSRLREIPIENDGVIVVEVAGYDTACYSNDKHPPFFAAELSENGNTVADSDDFSCVLLNDRVQKVERYSYQRNYIEVYNKYGDRETLYKGKSYYPSVKTEEVPFSVTLLGSGEDTASYNLLGFALSDESVSDLSELTPNKLWWTDYIKQGKAEGFLPEEYEFDFADFIKGKRAVLKTYSLPAAHTGFIKASFSAEKDGFALLVFDEYVRSETKPEILFQRSQCNDYILIELKKGKRDFLSFEPYELKYLGVYLSENVSVSDLGIIAFENNGVTAKFTSSDSELNEIFEAAVNTFNQNALDIFMDCPGRERAGWLCDSYYTASAEAVLCGKNDIEKRFLENYLVGSWNEIPEKMLPMCFPSELYEKVFIPNWAMWFVVELECFYRRTGEIMFIDALKNKVYGIFEYFKNFENEYGLLEDLESWIFVEWSVANDASHVCGVNVPSNMMYAKALESAARLYNDELLALKASKLKNTIIEKGFDGKVFRDNLVRKNGELLLTDNYSETCQYYAIFCGMSQGEEFERSLIEKYGTAEAALLPEASNMLTGHFLRLMWLIEKGERERFVVEAKRFFSGMAKRTGTLWENDKPTASCNHGFTSAFTVFAAEALFGYKGYDAPSKNLIFTKDYYDKIDCSLTLRVNDNPLEITIKSGKREINNGTDFQIEII